MINKIFNLDPSNPVEFNLKNNSSQLIYKTDSINLLIGKNGAGKTKLIREMIFDLMNNENPIQFGFEGDIENIGIIYYTATPFARKLIPQNHKSRKFIGTSKNIKKTPNLFTEDFLDTTKILNEGASPTGVRDLNLIDVIYKAISTDGNDDFIALLLEKNLTAESGKSRIERLKTGLENLKLQLATQLQIEAENETNKQLLKNSFHNFLHNKYAIKNRKNVTTEKWTAFSPKLIDEKINSGFLKLASPQIRAVEKLKNSDKLQSEIVRTKSTLNKLYQRLAKSESVRLINKLNTISNNKFFLVLILTLSIYANTTSKNTSIKEAYEQVTSLIDSERNDEYLDKLAKNKTWTDMQNAMEDIVDHIMKNGGANLIQLKDNIISIRIAIDSDILNLKKSTLRILEQNDFLNISLFQMSSGQAAAYDQIISIANGVKKLSDDGIKEILIFIDEADMLLHLEWQRRYIEFIDRNIEKLKKHYDVSCVQLIIATHSPLLASDILKDSITILADKNKENSQEKSLKPLGFGAPLQTIINNSFGVPTIGSTSERIIKGLLAQNQIPKQNSTLIDEICDENVKKFLKGKLQ